MATASRVAAKQAKAVQSMEERLGKIERQNNKILKLLNGAVEALESEPVEGEMTLHVAEGMWAVSDEEMQALMTTVAQLCGKAGLTWEVPNSEAENFDVMSHLQTHLAKIADVIVPAKPVSPQDVAEAAKPAESAIKQEAGRVGGDSVTGEKPAPTSGKGK